MSSTLPSTLTKDFLTCQVCLDHYTSPRMLPCLHSFCQHCLQQCMDNSSVIGGSTFPCPVCRVQTAIPEKEGALGFKLNFFLDNLRDTVLAIGGANEGRICKVCVDGSKVELYCIECRDFLCGRCSGAHRRVRVTQGHKLVTTAEFASGEFEKEIKERQKLICEVHDEPMKLFCDDCQGAICCNCKVTEHNEHTAIAVTDRIREDRKVLQGHVDKLRVRLCTIQMYFENLADYECDIDKDSSKVTGSISVREKELNEVIKQYSKQLSQRIAQITLDEKKDIENYRDLLTNHMNSLLQAREFTEQILKFGSDAEIVALSPDLKSKLDQMQAIPCVDLVHKQRLQLLFEATDLKDKDNNNVPKLAGEVVTRNLGSVFTPSVTKGNCVLSFQCHSATDENSCYIRSMAVTYDNQLVVLDQNNNKVKMFNMNGRLTGEFTFMEKMKNPVAVCVLQDGKIAILDEIRGIRVFSQSGRYVRCINTQTKAPFGMCTFGQDELLVTDRKLHCVNVSKTNGSFVKYIPGVVRERPVLNKPCGVAVIPPNRLVVADVQDHCVKVLDMRDGHLLCGYGSRGSSQTCHVNLPISVCVDHQQHLILADYHNNRLHLLNRDGRFITHVVDKSDNIQRPTSVVVSNDGLLVVATESGDVHVYKYLV